MPHFPCLFPHPKFPAPLRDVPAPWVSSLPLWASSPPYGRVPRPSGWVLPQLCAFYAPLNSIFTFISVNSFNVHTPRHICTATTGQNLDGLQGLYKRWDDRDKSINVGVENLEYLTQLCLEGQGTLRKGRGTLTEGRGTLTEGRGIHGGELWKTGNSKISWRGFFQNGELPYAHEESNHEYQAGNL